MLVCRLYYNQTIRTMITFTQIIDCNGTVVYEVISGQMRFVSSGRLQILLAYDGMVLLKVGQQFEYGICGGQKIIYDDTDPQFSLVLFLPKYIQDQWIVKINENSDAVISCLGEKSYLKRKHGLVQNGSEKIEENYTGEGKVLGAKVEEESDNKSSVLVDASKQIGKGLKFTGKLLSKGFQGLGGFIAKRMQKKEDKPVSETTKQNLKLAKDTTKNVLQFTSEQVGNLFRFGKKVASDVGERFEKSQKGQEMQQHPYYNTVKEGASTGVGVIANLYDGFIGAVFAVGGGVAKGAAKMVGARYGEDAGQAADQAFEGAGNIAMVMRVPQVEAAKALKQ